MSLFGRTDRKQRAFNDGRKHERQEANSIGAMIVNSFREIGTPRSERRVHQRGHEFERRRRKSRFY